MNSKRNNNIIFSFINNNIFLYISCTSIKHWQIHEGSFQIAFYDSVGGEYLFRHKCLDTKFKHTYIKKVKRENN